MSDPSFKLRAGASGPVVSGPEGWVLTANADGSVSFQPSGELITKYVTADAPTTELDFTMPAARKIVVTLDASTTFEIVWPPHPQVVIIQLVQGPGGNFVPTFPTEVRFSGGQTLPTWSTVATHWDELAIDWDGVHGTASYGTNYAP